MLNLLPGLHSLFRTLFRIILSRVDRRSHPECDAIIESVFLALFCITAKHFQFAVDAFGLAFAGKVELPERHSQTRLQQFLASADASNMS
jgi:hypothetical protein